MKPPAAQGSPAAAAAAAPALDSAAAGDLTDALCEFDAVLADFASPFHERHFRYEEHLERMKRRSSASVSDSSGFSDSESADSLYRNSFSFSDEKLNSPTDSAPALLSATVTPRKEKGEEGEAREKNINVWLPLARPQLGTWPTTQACTLTGNQTGSLSVHRPAPNPLSHTSQLNWETQKS